jgi:hypothetical protein
MKRALFATLLLAALAADAAAETDYIAKARQGRTVKKFDFTGDDIDATLVRPDGSELNVIGFVKHANLIKLRNSFNEKIMRDTENVP